MPSADMLPQLSNDIVRTLDLRASLDSKRRQQSISSEETCRGAAAPYRSGAGFLPTNSPNCARSSQENAAPFHTERAPGSRGGTVPCAKPTPVHRAPPGPPAQNPPPTRSASAGYPAATEISPCPSSSARKRRASSPALPERHGRLPSTHQTPTPV